MTSAALTLTPKTPPLAASQPLALQCFVRPGLRPSFEPQALTDAAQRMREPSFLVQSPQTGAMGVLMGEGISLQAAPRLQAWPLRGWLPPLYPEWLGDRSFAETHGTRFPYVAGAMANGIASTRLVIELSRNGCLAFFGAAGLSVERITMAVAELASELGDKTPWGCNLIHAPHEPAVENATADLYIRAGVKRVEAAAFMGLTPAIVRYALSGIRRDAQGNIVRKTHVFAKISRPEVARKFLEPAPRSIVDALVRDGLLTQEEAALAPLVAIAEDITVESDSGGHTDNRPLAVLFPTIAALRDSIAAAHRYTRPIRVGAAGGLGVPAAIASAFSLGAAFVVTGSVNQACIESGLDASGKVMLAAADLADVIMAPAADMFELGVNVQVLKRGTLFATRARKLYDIYRAYPSLEAVPLEERATVENKILLASFADAWASTRAYWLKRDPHEVERADQDKKHQMALVFRAYLGQSSRWAIAGQADRRSDFQIWCGPAMGAFNDWTRDSFLADPNERTVVQVARNFMQGAAQITRAHQLRSFGAAVPAAAFAFKPRRIR